jgi:hypothetical protein
MKKYREKLRSFCKLRHLKLQKILVCVKNGSCIVILWPTGIFLFFAIYWLFIGNKVSGWSWLQDDEHEGIRLRHFKVIFFAHFEHW